MAEAVAVAVVVVVEVEERIAVEERGAVRNSCACKRVLINAGGYVMVRTPRNKSGPMV